MLVWYSAGTAKYAVANPQQWSTTVHSKTIYSHGAVLLFTDNATDILQLCEALIYIFVLCVGIHCILNKLHCLVVKIDWLCVPPLTTVANMQHDEDAGQR